ncbi:MAG: DUF2628 domain-containing protein [Xanthobacteraceae bacterium]
MAIYTVHEPPRPSGNTIADADRFVFVRDGFYGWAFLLAPIWMIRRGLWLVLLLYLIVSVGLFVALWAIGASGEAQALVGLLLMILVGTEAATLRRWTLARRGWSNVGVVVGDDVESAERRFFASWFGPHARPPETSGAAAGMRMATPPDDVIGLFPQPETPR